MIIRKIEVFHVKLPLNFTFKTAKTTMNARETLVIKVWDELGHVGFGEVVAFTEPFYTDETIEIAKRTLMEDYLPKMDNLMLNHPFEIHGLFDQTHPMTIAGLENALLDAYAKRQKKSIMDVVFDEKLNEDIPSGMTIGDEGIENILEKIEAYKQAGYERFKIKIKPSDGLEKLKVIRDSFPDVQLLADMNGSFEISDMEHLAAFDQLGLACMEEPLNAKDFQAYGRLQERVQTPICLDESIQSMADLNEAIAHGACKVLNLKIGRVGGLYYAKEMIETCRRHNIKFWIGSMMESGISKILHVHLAGLQDTYIPGDLSASSRYFARDLIEPDIKVINGRINISKGFGLGVEVDEEVLKSYTIDHYQTQWR